MNDKSVKDWQLQLEAEQAIKAEGLAPLNPEAVLYRDIFAALGNSVPVELPEDFAAQIAQLAGTSGLPVEPSFDRWLAMGLRACLLMILVVSSAPYLVNLVSSTMHSPSGAGTAFLLQAIAAITLALLANAVLGRATTRVA